MSDIPPHIERPENPWATATSEQLARELERVSADNAGLNLREACLLVEAADRVRSAALLRGEFADLVRAVNGLLTEDQGDDEALQAAWSALRVECDEAVVALGGNSR